MALEQGHGPAILLRSPGVALFLPATGEKPLSYNEIEDLKNGQ
jgi:hypothetical protein